jgi:hypothetical protein
MHLLRGTFPAGKDSQWKKAPEKDPGDVRYWSPDGGLHYGFEAGGELLLIAASDYATLGQERRSGRFGDDGRIILTDESGEFTIRSTKPGSVTIGNFSYPLRLEGTAAGRSGEFLSGVLASTTDRIGAFSAMVDDNLFTRPLPTYRTLSLELRRYHNRIQSVTPSR